MLNLLDIFAITKSHSDFGVTSAHVLDSVALYGCFYHMFGMSYLSYMRRLCLLRKPANHQFVNLTVS